MKEFTETEIMLMDILIDCKSLDKDDRVSIMMFLETEENMRKMIEYLKDNPKANKNQISRVSDYLSGIVKTKPSFYNPTK